MGSWDDLLGRWRRGREPRDRRTLEQVAGHVGVLPGGQPARRWTGTVLVVLVAIALAVLLLLVHPGLGLTVASFGA